MLSDEELDTVFYRCCGTDSTGEMYGEVVRLRKNATPDEKKELFLWWLKSTMEHGRLKYLGETSLINKNERGDEVILFGDEPDLPTDVIVNGLKQPDDPSPEGIVRLIDSKWPPELEPRPRIFDPGFDSLWFFKWRFQWLDENGNPLYWDDPIFWAPGKAPRDRKPKKT